MTRTEVQTAVLNALKEAAWALEAEPTSVPNLDQSPFDTIPDFDSAAAEDTVTTICEKLSINDLEENPFLSGKKPVSLAAAIDRFCEILEISEE